MTNGSVLILGARSDIGLAVAHRFAQAGHPILLAARNATALDSDQADIALRYSVTVTTHEFDVLATETHSAFVDTLPQLPEVAVCAVGLLGNQAESEKDVAAAVLVMRTNYEGPASIMGELANRFEERSSGTLVGISSVAGERGRASNYVYGSAKAGFTACLSGLRNRLARKGVHVVTVLPGFVATKMTTGMNLPARLTAKPQDIADRIFVAVAKGVDTTYANMSWRLLMMMINFIPESVFKRLSIG
jgi:short-subunit dehydrogenase